MAIGIKRLVGILREHEGLPENERNAGIVRAIERLIENPKAKDGRLRAQMVASTDKMFRMHRPGLNRVERARAVAEATAAETGLNPLLDDGSLMRTYRRHLSNAPK